MQIDVVVYSAVRKSAVM